MVPVCWTVNRSVNRTQRPSVYCLRFDAGETVTDAAARAIFHRFRLRGKES